MHFSEEIALRVHNGLLGSVFTKTGGKREPACEVTLNGGQVISTDLGGIHYYFKTDSSYDSWSNFLEGGPGDVARHILTELEHWGYQVDVPSPFDRM